jgi:hypothetical protein
MCPPADTPETVTAGRSAGAGAWPAQAVSKAAISKAVINLPIIVIFY